MYKILNDRCYFAEYHNGVALADPFIGDFFRFLRGSLKESTLIKYISSIHKFWIYALYFPSKIGDSFDEYVNRYRTTLLERGFKVFLQSNSSSHAIMKKFPLYSFKKTKDASFDMHALEEFYKFILDKDLNSLVNLTEDCNINLYLSESNLEKLKNIEKNSKGKGYGLKARGMTRVAIMERKTVFTKYKSKKQSYAPAEPSSNEIFPLQAFDKLLEVTKNPRSRLLYLLCGACSARIGQALSFTKFDIDLENREVYLTDPRTLIAPRKKDGTILNKQEQRKILLARYGIDFKSGKYKRIGFKYPIPSKDSVSRELHFLLPKYKDMFFETYLEWRENMDINYPMVFQTHGKNGANILLPSSADTLFKGNLKRLDKFYPEFNILKLDNSFHSLRHMFGTCMADFAYIAHSEPGMSGDVVLPDGRRTNIIQIWKEFTRKKMGHTGLESTDIYFKMSSFTEEYLLQVMEEKRASYIAIKNKLLEIVGGFVDLDGKNELINLRD